MASSLSQIAYIRRVCFKDPSKYWDMWYVSECTWDESYNSSTNVLTCSNFKVKLTRTYKDVGYWASCNDENGHFPPAGATGCFQACTVSVATSLSEYPSFSQKGSYDYPWVYGDATIGTYSIPGSITINPRQTKTIVVARGGACSKLDHEISIYNSRSVPTPPAPTAPSFSAYGNCTSGSYSSLNFYANVSSYGTCDSASYSRSIKVYNASNNTLVGSSTSSSFSYTPTGLQANTRYRADFSLSNGCRSASASVYQVTPPGNSLSNATATGWNTGTVRLTPINGGGYATPSHRIEYKKSSDSTWKTLKTVTATSPVTVELTDLDAKTTYQVRAVSSSSSSSCSYTSGTVSFTTSEKCAQAYIAKATTEMNPVSYEVTADIAVNYTTFSSPLDIWVEYRVKDGYDTKWTKTDVITISDKVTNNTTGLTGSLNFRLINLFPNLVEYEVRVIAEAKQDDCYYESGITNFTTDLVPEPPEVFVCETMTYLSELVCQAIKRIYKGNITVLANPYTVAKCDPYNEEPTHLTIWSRLLRFFHAMNCLLCGMVENELKSGKPNQYYVGEVGWVEFLDTVVKDDDENSWRLVASGAVKAYLEAQLHEVWHFHDSVDYLVGSLDERAKLPSTAKSVIVGGDVNKVYVKSGTSWKEAADQPDDFAVYHINYDFESEVYGNIHAGSAWYYFDGTWNNLDAETADMNERLQRLEDQVDDLVLAEEGKPQNLKIVEKGAELPNDEDAVLLVVDEQHPAPVYHTVTFLDLFGYKYAEDKVLDGEIINAERARAYLAISGAQLAFVDDKWTWLKDGQPFDGNTPITEDVALQVSGKMDDSYGGASFYCVHDNMTTTLVAKKTLPWDLEEQPIVFPSEVLASGVCPVEGYDMVGWGLGVSETYREMALVESGKYDVGAFRYPYQNFYPLYRPTKLEVTFEYPWDGTNETVSLEYGDYVIDPRRRFADYIIDEWRVKGTDEYFPISMPITQSVTLYPVYRSRLVAVTFTPGELADVSDMPEPQTVRSGEFVVEPNAPTAEGYRFKYWQYKGREFSFNTRVFQNTTLEAVWERVYTVSFVTDGGEPTPQPQLVGEGDYATEPVPPTKPGCAFLGWQIDAGPITAGEYNEREITAQEYNDKQLTADAYNNNAKGML